MCPIFINGMTNVIKFNFIFTINIVIKTLGIQMIDVVLDLYDISCSTVLHIRPDGFKYFT